MKNRLPLEGLKVVELATVVATPISARLLSDYGAEVIKVEAPRGDLLRMTGVWHMLPTEDDNNPLFDLCNSGKKMITVDMKTEEGMKIFHRLLSQADIFLSNIRVQSLRRMKIDYDSIKEQYPSLIYAHFSGFGLKGEDANKPGYDSTAFWMRTGATTDITTPGSFPIRPSFAMGDIATASEFVAAILMAVIGRQKTGKGCMVTTSLLQSGIWCNAVAVMNAQPQYGKQYPVERFLPGNPMSDYYECSDGEYMALSQNDYVKDKQLFVELFDFPELAQDPDLDTLGTMAESGKIPFVAKKMQEEFLKYSSREWDQILTEHDVPHQLAGHFRSTYLDPQAQAMDAFDEVSYPGDTVTAIPRPPFEISGFERRPFEKTGAMGRDTDEVLHDLGYSEKEIKQMREAGSVW